MHISVICNVPLFTLSLLLYLQSVVKRSPHGYQKCSQMFLYLSFIHSGAVMFGFSIFKYLLRGSNIGHVLEYITWNDIRLPVLVCLQFYLALNADAGVIIILILLE